MTKIISEICVDSIESAIIAQEAGADRIELCDNLIVGGTTPSVGLIELCKKYLSIDISVIIRPRGGDFCYSKYDIEVMKRDIEIIKELGVEGVVIGVLNENGEINKEVVKELIEIARPLSVCFHRAFDRTKDLLKSFDDLLELGIDRLLTSGGEEKAVDGIKMLKQLNDKAGDNLIIMPGSGVNKENVMDIIKSTGVKEIHFSAKDKVASAMKYKTKRFDSESKVLLREFDYYYTNKSIAKGIISQFK